MRLSHPYEDYLQVASSELELTSEMLASGKGVTAADLAETIDIQITDEIKALAESLNTIIDPSTGAGAYKIAGGQNGGFLELLDGLLES